MMAVVVFQAFAFVGICLMAFALGRYLGDPRVGVLAAALTAAFSPLPYFAALAMTELWTTFLLTATLLAALRARAGNSTALAAAAGVLAGITALTRPVFVLLPFGLFGMILVVDWFRDVRRWLLATVMAGLVLAPWFTYNYVHFDRFTMSPANGFGRAVWESSWQGRWRGRLQDELTQLADRTRHDRAALDAGVHQLAARDRLDPGPMLDYVHQWQDIRALWFDVADPTERAMARMRADDTYMQQGIENAMADPIGHLRRRIVRGVPVLWAAEIPYRYSGINSLPVWVIRVIWAIQGLLVSLAVLGIAVSLKSPYWREAMVIAAAPIYITAVHWLLLTEARQSLPGMPAVLVLAAASIIWLGQRRAA
jgi:4-amino-4-deoxy-L-arabinose transferase-like glycosyltransferase